MNRGIATLRNWGARPWVALLAFVLPWIMVVRPEPVYGVQLSSEEQNIFDSLRDERGQRRPNVRVDAILTQVARARAKDMAVRRFFGHVNPDGFGPNYMVQKAGYELPEWWGNDAQANYIESIAAGYESARAVWEAWMESASHREHLLALDPFYENQTRVGVGYYADPGSPYQYYWVILTVPPEPKPVSIASPSDGEAVTTGTLVVTGERMPEVTRVTLSVGGGEPVEVALSGSVGWSASVALEPALNEIRVFGYGANGALLGEDKLEVDYVVKSTLTVLAAGQGSVTAGFLGLSERRVGRTYTVVATPAEGWVFAGWSGGIVASGASLTFEMVENLQLAATFVPDPFVGAKGDFVGLVEVGGETGYLSVKAGKDRGFSGVLKTGSTRVVVAGRFGLDGSAAVGVGNWAFSLHLGLGENEGVLSGEIITGTMSNRFSVNRAVQSARPGRYRLAVDVATGSGVPSGAGEGVLRVRSDGSAYVALRLPDGVSFTKSAKLTADGAVPLFKRLYDRKGVVVGSLEFSDASVAKAEPEVSAAPVATEVAGELLWERAGVFSGVLEVAGSLD